MTPERKVLVVGSGGREHALAWALARSRHVQRVYIAPGNAGTERVGTNVPIDPMDFDALVRFASEQAIDLTVVGPEDPLCGGIVDRFESTGLPIFGPTAAAARLEGDKAFAKQIMRQQGIPTAEFRVFTDYALARQYIASRDYGLVVKAAGLARGKGSIVCEDPADAIRVAEKMLVEGLFGEAGRKIVVEEQLKGTEVSVMALVSGHTIYLLEPARDYKRARDGDQGPNTGGMGAFSPAPPLPEAMIQRIEEEILVPTVAAMEREGAPYRGLLYVGLMITPAGPKVLEYNCRFGDPETQPTLLRLRSDLYEILEAVVRSQLEEVAIDWRDEPAVCVVLASRGYPGRYETGYEVHGLDEVPEDIVVFHAGTRREDGRVVTAGGRVLGVTACGRDLETARERAYLGVERIRFEGKMFRSDIGILT